MNWKNLVDPLSKNMHLVIIALYAYVLLCHVGKDEYVTMVILTAATCLSICYLKKNEIKSIVGMNSTEGYCDQCGGGIEGFSDDGVEGFSGGGDSTCNGGIVEGFENPKEEAEKGVLPTSMGPFDGLCLKTGNKEYWMKSPDNTSLIPDSSLFAYLSSQGPLKPVFTDNTHLHGPPIDGKKGSPEKMFMFANNQASPACCPSTFSTSTGCVCTTDKQRDFVAARGYNNL